MNKSLDYSGKFRIFHHGEPDESNDEYPETTDRGKKLFATFFYRTSTQTCDDVGGSFMSSPQSKMLELPLVFRRYL